MLSSSMLLRTSFPACNLLQVLLSGNICPKSLPREGTFAREHRLVTMLSTSCWNKENLGDVALNSLMTVFNLLSH